MTLVSLPSPIYWPGNAGSVGGGPSLGTAGTLDASGEYFSYIQIAREDMVISHISFRAGATTTAQVVVSIEGVDGSGFPDGASTFGGSASVATAVSTNTNPIIALGGSATVAKGSVFAVKILWSAGSVVVQNVNQQTPFSATVPYSVTNTSGSPAKSAGTGLIGFGSSATTFYSVPGHFPMSATSISGTFNNTSGARRGLKFVPPMTARAVGIRTAGSTSVGNYDAILYDVSDNVLSTISVDGDVTSASNNGTMLIFFSTQVVLSAGSTYRIAIVPTSATNVSLGTITLPSADFFGASPAGSSAIATYSTYASGSWTDSTTTLPYMDVILDQLDDGAGSGVVGVIGG
jgi:hypothetical protein